MKPVAGKKETVVRGEDEEARKLVDKKELKPHNIDTVKHVERKMVDKGVLRLERHPRDGLPLVHNPKSGHGGKYTWEGPAADELEPAPPAVDEKDPNYVAEEEEDGGGLVIGEVDVAKVAEEGVARIEVDPELESS